MPRRLIVLSVLLLATCAEPPPPSPPAPPPPIVEHQPPATADKPRPASVAALRVAYADAARRLRAYLAQGPCVPSGPTNCADHDQVIVANEAQRVAHNALLAAERHASAVHMAELRVGAFRALMTDLGQ